MIFQSSKSPTKPTENDDERFEKLFSRSFQLEQDELIAKNFTPVDTLTSKYEAVSKEGKMAAEGERDETKTEEQKGLTMAIVLMNGCVSHSVDCVTCMCTCKYSP